MNLAPEGKPILLAAAVLAIVFATAGLLLTGWAAVVVTLLGWLPLAFSIYFFRDPPRRSPEGVGVVVAPADGKIIEINSLADDGDYGASAHKISIFMSPFNVHVNRIPIGGRIQKLRYQRGKYTAAFQPKASLDNERQYIEINSPYGLIGCTQVAGWLARRIVCHLQEGQDVATGERFGMIRFGSRLDLYLPPACDLSVQVRDRVFAGESIIGVFHEEK
jgi:phosphatidylserine decarboxylase